MSETDNSSSGAQLQRFLPGSARIRDRLGGLVPRLKAHARLIRRKVRGRDLSTLAEKLEGIDEEFVAEGARSVEDTDIETVVDEADAIEERFRGSGPLRRLLEDGQLLLGLVRDVRRGQYTGVPVWTLSAAAFALLYVLNPLDMVPDALPILGVLDDAAVVSACLVLLEQDLHDYREWRRQMGSASESNADSEREGTQKELAE